MRAKWLLTAFCLALFSMWIISALLVPDSFCATPVAPPVEWVGQENGVAVQQIADGSFVLFGKTSLSRVDSEGNLLWKKDYSSIETQIDYRIGQQTSDNGYILIGGIPETAHVGDIGTGDALMQKADDSGNPLWNKTYGGIDHEYAFCGQQTSDGGYVFAGTFALAGIDNEFYMVKTDSAGNTIWNKTYGETLANEIAWSVIQTPDGGFIMAGEKTPLFENWTEAWVVKTDSNGDVLWNNTYGGSKNDWLYRVRATTGGGYIFSGCRNRDSNNSTTTGDFWLLKTDEVGSIQWEKSFTETATGQSSSDVQQTTDGGYIAIGQTFDPVETCLVKTDSLGERLWEKTFSGRRSVVIQTSDRGYAVTGDLPLAKLARANPPVATFTYEPLNPLVQQTITFTASNSHDLDNDISSYEWDFKDGNITPTSNPVISHAFSTSGVYNVTLTVTDSEGLSSIYAQEVSTQVSTSISISASSQTIHAYTPVTFSGRLIDSQGRGVGNVPISVSSTITGLAQYNLISEKLTDYQGYYNLTWNPSILGQLTIKAEWEGNQTHNGVSNSTSIEVLINPTDLSIRLSSSSSDAGLRIGITGNLSSNGVGLPSVPVLLSYSLTEGQTWTEISQPVTTSTGGYSALWTPMATGKYVVRAVNVENATIQGATAFADLAVVEYDTESFFSVTSNSTISSLSYESANRELKFDVSGSNGTTGYVEVAIAKSLIEDIQAAEVRLNGATIEYSSSSSDTNLFLYFSYSHSTQSVAIRLDANSFLKIPINTVVLFSIPLVAVFVAVLLLQIDKRKQKETAKGKENSALGPGSS